MQSSILKLINDSDSILLLTHEQPDGDAIGSVMSLYYFLIDMNKKVDVVIPVFPPVFNYLNFVDKIENKSDKKYDLCIVCDCSKEERIGQTNNEFNNCHKKIVIDHHVSNTNYGDVNFVDDKASSCCQIIYYLLKKWKVNYTKDMGEALITGMLTDTNGFANSDVDKKTFLMAADLFDIGIDFHNIYYNALLKRNKAQFMLTKLTLDRLEFFGNGKIAFSYINKEDFDMVGAVLGDHEGLVDIGRNIEGVEVSVFVREDSRYRVSFRSNGNVNVNHIANKFGGGGHVMAAGATIDKTFEETKKLLINEIIKELSL